MAFRKITNHYIQCDVCKWYYAWRHEAMGDGCRTPHFHLAASRSSEVSITDEAASDGWYVDSMTAICPAHHGVTPIMIQEGHVPLRDSPNPLHVWEDSAREES